MQRLLVFERCCLCGVGIVWQGAFLSSSEVRRKVLDPRVQFSGEVLNLNRLN